MGRSKDGRTSLRRLMVSQLFEHERIQTTRAKAEAVRGQAERLITLAKRGNEAGEAHMVHARRLVVAPATVKRHTLSIYSKLGVPGRHEAVIKARRLGILSTER